MVPIFHKKKKSELLNNELESLHQVTTQDLDLLNRVVHNIEVLNLNPAVL
jgi:hypothetical protein